MKGATPIRVGAQPWSPEPYMLAAVSHLLENPEAALFLDPG